MCFNLYFCWEKFIWGHLANCCNLGRSCGYTCFSQRASEGKLGCCSSLLWCWSCRLLPQNYKWRRTEEALWILEKKQPKDIYILSPLHTCKPILFDTFAVGNLKWFNWDHWNRNHTHLGGFNVCWGVNKIWNQRKWQNCRDKPVGCRQLLSRQMIQMATVSCWLLIKINYTLSTHFSADGSVSDWSHCSSSTRINCIDS